jgi:asparagine synthase (glutamine-hydrolysing)
MRWPSCRLGRSRIDLLRPRAPGARAWYRGRVCGIFGAVDLEGQRRFPAERLTAMGDAVAHRGPDDHGTYCEPGLALGARRLALVDPARGHQPVADASGRFVAVANGELFHHREERARLEARGARFRSRCDTEVWVHAVALDGEDYLAAARGQFAVALWDATERRLILARDRFGICPLYTARADGWLLFASEIKALFASGLVRAALDPRAVDHVFACLCASPVRSAFEGVTPVPPGHRLAVRAGAAAGAGRATDLARFAGIEFPPRGQERRAGDAGARDLVVDELERALEAAVARRLDVDAPVATYLSGGVDSSLIVALASRIRPGNVTSFSVRLSPDLGLDESDLAAETARSLGVHHVVVPVDPAHVAGLFRDVVLAAEVPVLDHADTALLALSREVRARGFKAALTGEGADEAFAGYPWDTLLHSPRMGLVARAGAAALGAAIGGGRARFTAAGAFGETGAGRLYALTSRGRAFLYAPSFWERLKGFDPAADHAWDEARVACWHPLHRSLYADYECVLAGHLLADKGDRVAMASSVEPRFPFLDEEVVDLAASLDPSLKLRRGQDKWVLRQLAARLLPRDASRRRKHMFRAEPVIHAAGRPAWVDELLSERSLRETALFDPAAVARALARRDSGRVSARASLLQGGLSGVVSTQLLSHLFCGGGLCSLPAWSPPALRDR